jgi:pyruvate/2-oxoglutarate dehydrogenase complex dihydrolipoamide dehydrogenase (E3) component
MPPAFATVIFVELIMGDGSFVEPKTLQVRFRDGGTRVLRGERVFVNVGTESRSEQGNRLRIAL